MAPMLGLLRSMAERGVERKVTFYYGARTQQDLCFVGELAELAEQLSDFTLRPRPVRTPPTTTAGPASGA